MRCSICKKKAVFKNPSYCHEHFIDYIETTVLDTVEQFQLVKKGEKLIVAASGGKDSITCLHILSKKYKVEALAIDEGIKGYREETLEDLKEYCDEHNIRYHIYSIEEELGYPLDILVRKAKEKPCTVCGAIRRYMINRHARLLKAKKLATGHNLDDEAQAVMMNLFRNQLEISARLGPMTGLIKDKRFITRVKPLYFLSEKEITAYTLLKNFSLDYSECPYAGESYRGYVRDLLNDYEQKHPGTKRNIIQSFLKQLPVLKEMFATDKSPRLCKECGEPARQEICRVCKLILDLKKSTS